MSTVGPTPGAGAGGPEGYRGLVGRTVAESTPWWPAPHLPPAGSPDVVLVVLDDVGFADLGCYGADLATPTVDRLAGAGIRYNNFHTTALCSPTRACLLTGRNHHSVGMGVVSNWDTGFPGYRGRVTHRAATLAETLRAAGYGTLAVGKWHLAPIDETTAAGPYDQWPLGRGFDRYYGFLDGATNHFGPDLVVDNHRVDPPHDDGYHLTEDLVDQAIGMVAGQVSVYPEKPFFLYLCFGTAHSPLQAPRPFIDACRGRFDHGWDEERERRLARQVALGVVPPGTRLAPRNAGVEPWAALPADRRRLSARFQEVYAGMLTHTDAQLGRLVDALAAMGRLDDTLLVLLSDNGATLEGGPDGSANYLRAINGLGSEDLAEGLAGLDELGGPATYPVYPMGWGQASNTPLKRYKQNTHAGGVRDPLIVFWPARIRHPGAICPAFCHAVDVAPTILDLLRIAPPDELAGVPQMAMEGTSVAATLADPSAPTPKKVQYFEMLGNRGIWAAGWKAVAYHQPGTPFDDDRWELYHLDEDFSECDDLADRDADRLRALQDQWWEEARAHAVLPLDDRILERFLVDRPRPVTDRRRFVYYPGARVPTEGAAPLIDVSYTVEAEVGPYRPATQGVLVAHGDRFGGYALFVQDGRLVHDYNRAGVHLVVVSDEPVPEGATRLGYRFTRTGRCRGRGTLLVDGRPAGRIELDRTLGVHLNAIGISVGADPYSGVSRRYDVPFPYAGPLVRVVIEVQDDRGSFSPWLAD